MNNAKIDWCDMTWNPVTGCLHGCPYCYAREIAWRFGGNFTMSRCTSHGFLELYGRPDNPYPDKFDPTFHRYRLGEPTRKKKPQTIFVGSMTDLFGEWVPDEWIKQVFDACAAAPWHRYLFLTKNPDKLPPSSYLYGGVFDKHSDNMWFGMSATTQKDLEKSFKHFTNINGNIFISIEPIHDEIDLSRIDVGDVIYKAGKGMAYYFGGGQKFHNLGWVIVGAETGNRKGKVTPQRDWIEKIVEQCCAANIPIFMKESLRELMGYNFVQEFPWENDLTLTPGQ